MWTTVNLLLPYPVQLVALHTKVAFFKKWNILFTPKKVKQTMNSWVLKMPDLLDILLKRNEGTEENLLLVITFELANENKNFGKPVSTTIRLIASNI